MGAQQSSGAAGAGAGPDAGAIKTSYYELLDIERTATDDEIKKAYRKKALELHPDRNYGDVERTTALFADIQTAYQVLSDPHERAWYDAHEGDILRGSDGQSAGDDAAHYEHNMRVTTADELARMMGKFRAGIDYSDAPSGFYGFVRDAFDQLAREEQHAADFSGARIPDYPSFGHKDDEYDDVVRSFYAVWSGFATIKSFSWMDRYRPSDAPDRRVRRAIDKENKKFRDEGIREFNDAVRTLVAFVRKRDPRYTPNTQSPEEAAKAQREASKAKAAKARAANAAKWQEQEDAVPEWARARDADEELEETEDEEEEEHFECVACRKTFKSERQYDAHEKSKKHQKAVYALRKKMQKDNAELDLDGSAAGSGALTPVSADGEPEVDELADRVHSVNMDSESEGDADEVVNADEHTGRDEPDTDQAPPPRAPHAAPNTTSSPQREPSEQAERFSDPNSEDTSESDENDEYAARSTVEARFAQSLSPNPLSHTSADPVTTDTPNSDANATSAHPPSKKLGAAALKRAKRAAKLQAEEASASATDDAERAHKCAKCGEGFASKTKLFKHIKERGHVAPVSEVKAGGGKKKR